MHNYVLEWAEKVECTHASHTEAHSRGVVND